MHDSLEVMDAKKMNDMANDRLDVAFIYPPWPVLDDRSILQNSLPPLGILSIASFLESLDYEVKIWDVHAEKLPVEELRKRLRQDRPKFIGISVLTNMAIPAQKIARVCREEVPDATIVVGGTHAEAMPERMLMNSAIDAVVRGDGEEPMREIIEKKPFSEILGLSYRDGLEVIHNRPRPMNMDLDKYPMPAYHLVDFGNYFPAVGQYRNLPAINMLMTRGCPGKCTFCNSARTILRTRKAAKVVEQIKYLHETFGIRQVQFYDDTFTVMKKNCLEFCELLAKENLNLTWTAYIRGDCFSEDLAIAMKKAGCHQVLMGIETGNAKVAKRIGKPIQFEKYHQTVAIARKHGLEVRGSFIIGNMDETTETMNDTLQFAMDLDIDLFQLNISTPYPGSALYKEAVENNTLRDDDWYSYGQGRILIDQPQITDDEIHGFERYAFRKFYLRPKTIYRMVKRVTNFRLIRDYFLSAAVLLLGKHAKQHTDAWEGWRNLKEEDFLDLDVKQPEQVRLTFELRQSGEFT